MIRIIDHRHEAAPDEKVMELRVSASQGGDVCGYIVPTNLTMRDARLDDLAAPVHDAFLDAVVLCEMEGIGTLLIYDPLGLFSPADREI